MKNLNLKHAIFTVGLAVLSGALLLGVQVAIGAPTVAPPGNGVSPTFTGLTSNGHIDLNGDLDVETSATINAFLYAKGDAIFSESLTAKKVVNAEGDVLVKGTIKQPSTVKQTTQAITRSYPPVKFEGDLEIKSPGNIDVQGGIINSNIAGGGRPVSVKDDLQVLGKSTFENDALFNWNVGVTQNLDVKGKLTLEEKPEFKKGLDFTGNSMKADLSNAPLIVSSDSKAIGMDADDIQSKGGPLYLNYDSGNAVNVGSDLSVSKNLDLKGAVTSDLNLKKSLIIPSGNGRILNTDGNAVLQTAWSDPFGDYTAINSGYGWGAAVEPVSVVAGNKGVFFMKGSYGTAYKTELGRFDTNGNLRATNTYSNQLTLGSTRPVSIDSLGYFGYVPSSKVFKENISDMEDLSWFDRLRPVNYSYIDDDKHTKQYGLIAEEVEEVNPLFVSYGENGEVQTVLYQNLIAPIIKMLQNQKSEIERLSEENAQMKAALCELNAEFEFCG